ncbi:hypothetical protein GCM10011316_06800 [Roseibium aquae]|uniref:Flagellar protein FlaG n=1 Tax=Roseibium aquae TaxID=1323746 RepID=A0A916T9Z4_9HYPH|nr:hypothetical protein [Roseibium aquae]GGB37321.1 hypothetical protein GCM10011316_06800 [Roseibium aquae]
METGLARPPMPSYTAISPVERAPERTERAAKTDLPRNQTVAPASETDASSRPADDRTLREPTREPVQIGREIERKNVIDPESNSMIYMATDSETGEVIRQVPSETLRRLRAYADAIANQEVSANQTSRQDSEETRARTI